jgi:hypothetical protein
MGEQVASSVLLEQPARQSLFAEALGLYTRGWGTQLLIYGSTFILALAVALIADLGFGMPSERVVPIVIASTVALLFVVPFIFAFLWYWVSPIGSDTLRGDEASIERLKEAIRAAQKASVEIDELRRKFYQRSLAEGHIADYTAQRDLLNDIFVHYSSVHAEAQSRDITEADVAVLWAFFELIQVEMKMKWQFESRLPLPFEFEKSAERAAFAAMSILCSLIQNRNIQVNHFDDEDRKKLEADIMSIPGREEPLPR